MGNFAKVMSNQAMSNRDKYMSMDPKEKKSAFFNDLIDSAMARKKASGTTMPDPRTQMNTNNQPDMGSALRNTLFKR